MKMTEESAGERNAATYRIYLQLHAARHAYPAKTLRTVISELNVCRTLRLEGGRDHAGRAQCLPPAGKNRIQGIERAHLTDRFKMIVHILDRDEPMTQDDLFDYRRETDQV